MTKLNREVTKLKSLKIEYCNLKGATICAIIRYILEHYILLVINERENLLCQLITINYGRF